MAHVATRSVVACSRSSSSVGVPIPVGRTRQTARVADTSRPLFLHAFPYQEDVLALPVEDLDAAARWYSNAFGLREVERRDLPHQAVILERDGVKIGFALTGGDASQDGAAIQVSDIERVMEQISAAGVEPSNVGVEEKGSETRRVFFVVAPDGLCFYFFETVSD